MDLGAAGVPVCIVRPEELRREEDCNGLAMDVLERSPSASAPNNLLFALARTETTGVLLTVSKTPHRRSSSGPNLEAVFLGFQKDMMSTMPRARFRGTTPGSRFDSLTLNGAPAMRMILETQEQQNPTTSLVVNVFADRASITAVFSAEPTQFGEAQLIADRLLKTLTVRALDSSAGASTNGASSGESNDDVSASYRLGRIIGGGVFALMAVVGFAVGAASWIRSRRTAAELAARASGAAAVDPAWRPRAAATASYAFPLLGALGSSLLRAGSKSPGFDIVFGVFFCVLTLACIGASVYALAALRTLGKRGILWPALAGLLVNAAFIGLASWGLLAP
ncbi:hypothetical protein [Sorangium sp. So ce124]|uniref:hypothetical protein n=1 Tax=Sorangium sp. So ce124 TaxID=3133280 RepID=UPI003F63DB87